MRRFALALAIAGAALAASGVARAEPKDDAAKKVLTEIEDDYLETHFDAADQKLRAAIDACGNTMCGVAIRAKLHVALGSILAAGKRQLEDAKEEFVQALRIDRDAKLIADMSSSEVTYAFDQARHELKLDAPKPSDKPAEPAPKPEPEKTPPKRAGSCSADADCDTGRCLTGTCEPKPEPPPPSIKNWVFIAFTPDVSVVSGSNVCSADAQASQGYVCLRESKSRYVGTPVADNGNNIDSGFALGTMRVLLGYDRVFAENFTLGVRLGFAFNGATDGGASFLPIHAEARAAFYPGRAPFSGAGVRPYFFLGAGVAEIDSRVDVEVLEDGKVCKAANPNDVASPCTLPSKDGVLEKRRQTLSTYRQNGPGFASLGAGLSIAPVPSAAFHVGARGAFLFPTTAFAILPEAGFLIGF